VSRKMNAEKLARAIRQDLAAELDVGALYQVHIDATDDEQAEYIKKGKTEIAELLKEK